MLRLVGGCLLFYFVMWFGSMKKDLVSDVSSVKVMMIGMMFMNLFSRFFMMSSGRKVVMVVMIVV